MGEEALPRRLEDVSEEWLTSALRESGELREGSVLSAEVALMAEGVGLMSQIGRITLRFSDDAAPTLPDTMVVKLPATRRPNREMAERFGLFERETRFYAELADRVGVRTPRVFVNSYDRATGDAVLVLEELPAPLGDSTGRLSDDDVREVVRAMARLHATWWEGHGTTPPSWIPRLDGPTWSTHEAMFAEAWHAFGESANAARYPDLAALGSIVAPAIPDLQQRLTRPPVTLVHLDFRSSNIFLCATPSGVELTLIDWQPMSIARGAYDLGYYTSQSLPTDQRRALEGELVDLYHSVLALAGVRGYTIDELWEDYRLSVAYTSSYAVATSLIDLANSTGHGYANETLARVAAAVVDLDVRGLLTRFVPSPT